MDKWWIAPVVGAAVFLFGAALLRWNRLAWRQQQNDSGLDDLDRDHYHRRHRRRMQMAVMLMVIGALVGVGEVIGDWINHPALFAVYWLVVLVLLLWIVLMSLADMASTTTHSRVTLARIRQKQRELNRQLAEFKERRIGGDGARLE